MKRAEEAKNLRRATEEEIATLKRRLEKRERDIIGEFLQGSIYSGVVTDVSVMAIRSCVSEMMDRLSEQAALLEKLSEEYIETLVSSSASEDQVADGGLGAATTSSLGLPVEGPPLRDETTTVAEDSDINL